MSCIYPPLSNVESPGNNPVHGVSQFNTCGDIHWSELLMSGYHRREASVMFTKAQHVGTEHDCYFIRHPRVVDSVAPVVNACLSSTSHVAGLSSHVAYSRRFASRPRCPRHTCGNQRWPSASASCVQLSRLS